MPLVRIVPKNYFINTKVQLTRLLKKSTHELANMQTSEPIYKFFTGKFLPDWYQLSEEEQKGLLAKLHEALEKLGAKTVVHCNTYWSSDQWMWAGVEEFPNIEAVQKYMATLRTLNWNRYVEGNNVLGTKS